MCVEKKVKERKTKRNGEGWCMEKRRRAGRRSTYRKERGEGMGNGRGRREEVKACIENLG